VSAIVGYLLSDSENHLADVARNSSAIFVAAATEIAENRHEECLFALAGWANHFPTGSGCLKLSSSRAGGWVEIPVVIHPTAIVSPLAKLGNQVRIGPYCVIGANVELGDECVLHSHVVLEGHSTFGRGNEFFPFAMTTPFSPPSGLGQWLFHEPPAKSKFLAVAIPPTTRPPPRG